MQLNPVQHRVSKLSQRSLLLRPHRNPFQLAAESHGKFPARHGDRHHPGLAAIAAMQSIEQTRLIRRRIAELLAADNAAIHRREPTTKLERPVGEVRQGQSPFGAPLNLSGCQEKQPEHRFGHFLLWQNPLRNLADDRQTGAEPIVRLRPMERLQQFALLNPHQVPRLFLDIPNLDMREKFQRRPVPVFQPPGTSGHSADATGRATEETDQAICFAQWEGLQNDGFCFPGGHELSACRLWLAIRTLISTTNAQMRTRIFITRTRTSQSLRCVQQNISRKSVGNTAKTSKLPPARILLTAPFRE